MPQTKNIPLREEFDDGQGRFENYDAYELGQREALREQAHVDIRTFQQADVTRTIPILYLNLLAMNSLNNKTMQDLEGVTVVERGEQWTVGTVGEQADRNRWKGITVSCEAGAVTTTESVIRSDTI